MTKLFTAGAALLQLLGLVAGEIVFLSNCEDDFYSGVNYWSEMDYYTNTPPRASSPPGTAPQSKTGHLNGGSYVHWEGATTCGNFPDTQFCAYIESNAASQSPGTYVGHGTNGYGTTFNCYKDDSNGGRYLYSPDTSSVNSECDAIYYCSN